MRPIFSSNGFDMSEKTPTTRPKRPLTEAQKAEAIALWQAGNATLSDLEERFKKDKSTFMRLFEKAGVKKGELAHETKQAVQDAVKQSMIDDAGVLADRIKKTKEDHYRMSEGIGKLVWNTLAKAQQDKRPLATVAGDLRSLNLAAATLKIVREERYIALGINNGDDNDDKPLPGLVIQELTAEDIEQMHREQAQAQDEETGLLELDDSIGDEDASIGDDRVEVDD